MQHNFSADEPALLEMLFNIAVKHGGQYLLVIGSGDAEICDMLALIDVTARIAQRKKYTHVLLDFLLVRPDITPLEHVELATHTAVMLSKVSMVASAVASEFRTGASEKAAQMSGANLRTFTDLHSAERWLMAHIQS